jgi:hypothetical protein
MSKTQNKKVKGFREFYEDAEEENPQKKKPVNESKKARLKFKQKLKNFNPEDFDEEDFDDLYDQYK